jgi:hypothetical protein
VAEPPTGTFNMLAAIKTCSDCLVPRSYPFVRLGKVHRIFPKIAKIIISSFTASGRR